MQDNLPNVLSNFRQSFTLKCFKLEFFSLAELYMLL